MKSIFVFMLALLSATTVASAQGKVNLKISTERQQKVSAAIKQQGKYGSDDVKSSTIYVHPTVRETTQDVSYLIKIQNMGPAATGLVVKYTLFARDRATQQIEATVQDQQTVDIKSLQTQSMKTKSAQFSATTAQYTDGFKDRKQGSESAGIGVAVYFGNTRVATCYDPPGLERQAAKINSGL